MLTKGQSIFAKGFSMDFQTVLEPAKIVRYVPNVTAVPDDEWYLIRYRDGSRMTCHRSNIRTTEEATA